MISNRLAFAAVSVACVAAAAGGGSMAAFTLLLHRIDRRNRRYSTYDVLMGEALLRDAVLAALLEGESSGYDLAKDFDASVANFWMATPQQLYRELDRLAEEGLIKARIVHQERRPNKRMLSLTEAGREAIQEFTGRAPKPSVIRDELMVKVQAADAGNAQAVRDFIAERGFQLGEVPYAQAALS